MDILDIDEALKDDSFIFLEDKTHDDVSNILQQWKSNNCVQQQQQQQEQAYKLNSRTFTRPKRKLVQNLESQFNTPQACNGSPMLSMEIGGLVTTMQKSFLQDTSPPASICSSMNASMNASLITSADFINVNFLQSVNGHDLANDAIYTNFQLANKVTNDGYTLSDMIRDRKALESLTLSGDGTLIKDCNIGQIDNMSITLSKSASNCSTMNNSTESVEANNRTVELTREIRYFNGPKVPTPTDEAPLQATMKISDELIGDTTLNLVENSVYSEKQYEREAEPMANLTHHMTAEPKSADDTFKKPTCLNETVSVNKANCTFDCPPPEANCGTPEADNRNTSAMKFYESTPQTVYNRYSKQQQTPSTAVVSDINLSPIVAPFPIFNPTRVLSETFECDPKLRLSQGGVNSDTFSAPLPQELLENVSNPNATFSKSEQQGEADAAMQNLINLAKVEANLLTGNENEAEFDEMLDEFSKVHLNAEQMKMKKSLDSIKKRFTYGLTEKHERELSREAKDVREPLKDSNEGQGDDAEKQSFRMIANSNIVVEENESQKLPDPVHENDVTTNSVKTQSVEHARDSKESMPGSKESPKEPNGSYNSSTSLIFSGGERLLSRRSRLYDDVNMSTVPTHSKSPMTAHTSQASNDRDMIVETKDTREKTEVETDTDAFTEGIEISNTDKHAENTETETFTSADDPENVDNSARRLCGKRERDRDRFKTIEIIRNRTPGGKEESGERLNVPCIDDMQLDAPEETKDVSTEMLQPAQRFSRRDYNSPSITGHQPNSKKGSVATNINYLTYKKPKDKPARRNLLEIVSAGEATAVSSTKAQTLQQPRSLSRPRYITGLQKFSLVSKATSAGDLEKASAISAPAKQMSANMDPLEMGAPKVNANASHFNRTQPIQDLGAQGKELKSPMGMKSKSFHNLPSKLGGSSSLPKPSYYGFQKTTYNSAGTSTEKQAPANSLGAQQSINLTRTAANPAQQQQQQKQQNEKCAESEFKVPRLVSGIRAPTGVKRAGLVRPSSGYYSLNVNATVKSTPQTLIIDLDADRHSLTDSTSSASSRSSIHSAASGLKPPNSISASKTQEKPQLSTTLTKITTGATGIPKPSGLRPPSNIKRSGLPRPSSWLKR